MVMFRPELRAGDWRDVLVDLADVDALIVDSPYGARTHAGHDAGVDHTMGDRAYETANPGVLARGGRRRRSAADSRSARRRKLGYDAWTPDHVEEFVQAWSPRVSGWFCAFSCSDLSPAWRASFERAGRCTFAPVACVIRAMSVRLAGDGPSSWTVYLNAARPRTKAAARWGTLPGTYVVNRTSPLTLPSGTRVGGKPLELMLGVVRDYSRPGDLIVDPCAGYATTGRAATMLGRRFIGAEVDPAIAAVGAELLAGAIQLDMFSSVEGAGAAEQLSLFPTEG